jgi:hypothetical protein
MELNGMFFRIHLCINSKKNINMKQLLPLFLFLLPCLALAQYPSNGNQKITLGEQTTADGLIYRGVAADTTLTAKSDTGAYFVLDTANLNLYTYKASATGKKWIQLGSDTTSLNLVSRFAAKLNISDTATMLTPYWRAGRFSGTLPVANGGTNATTLTANKVMVGNGTSGVLTPTNLHWDNTNSRLGIGNPSPSAALHIVTTTTSLVALFNSNQANASFRIINSSARGGRSYSLGSGDSTSAGGNGLFVYDETGASARLLVNNVGNIGIATTSPTQKLHVVGNARITAMNAINDIGADANGVLQAATSDMNLKNTIENSPFGLNEILLLNPVTFLYNDVNRKLDSDVKEVGFIAQDVFDIIPNAVSSTGMGDLQLDYRAITATLVKAIQEQNSLIKALEQRIINLENK